MGSYPSTTHLIYETRPAGEADISCDSTGECCFCGCDSDGLPAEDAISYDYFTDFDLMQSDTGHVCTACAYCMSNRSLKSGHWIATPDTYESPSTGDLPDAFTRLRDGEYSTPAAIHISENPIRSEHAYLWTKPNNDLPPLTLTYSRQTVRTDFTTLFDLVQAVEDLRWHGFRLDDIRSGEPRVSDVSSIGRETYRLIDSIIDEYRRTPLLEVAITLSQSKSDQTRDDGVDTSIYTKYE